MIKRFILGVCGATIFTASAQACGIQGTAVYSDGSKMDGTATISTSWNGKKAFPRNGQYQLNLGSSVCGQTIAVYLNGNNGRRVTVNGWTTVNFRGR